MTVPLEEGVRYFDLYHGVELTPQREGDERRAVLPHRSARLRRRARYPTAP